MNHAADNTKAYEQPTKNMKAADRARIAAILNELHPENNPKYTNTDIGDGKLFADVYRDYARYVTERKSWFVYDGKIWKMDVGNLLTMKLCKELARALLSYASTIKDDKLCELYTKHVKRWQKRQAREIILRDASDEYPISAFQFDTNPLLLNCLNGTLDLLTSKLLPHKSEDLLTKIAPVNYDPTARCERFERFISEITSEDTEKAVYLQKAFGYAATGDTSYECMFVLYGATSRNGKGTLTESVLSVLGDYGCAANPETLAQKLNSDSSRPSEDIARLFGIRFANISEPPKGMTLNAVTVKQMTGRDTLTARFLHENSFNFKSQFKLFVSTNHSLLIDDPTLFTSERIILIPFDRHFSEQERDIRLKDEFSKPQSQSAILNWMVDGYRMLISDGFKKPDAIKQAIKEYQNESDKTSQFIEETLVRDSNSEIRTSDLYHKYTIWCSINDCPRESAKSFNVSLKSYATIDRKRPKTGGEKTTLLLGYRFKDAV